MKTEHALILISIFLLWMATSLIMELSLTRAGLSFSTEVDTVAEYLIASGILTLFLMAGVHYSKKLLSKSHY